MANVAATTSQPLDGRGSGRLSAARAGGQHAAGQETKACPRTSAPRPVQDRRSTRSQRERPRPPSRLHRRRHGEHPERRQDTDSAEGGGRRAHGNVSGARGEGADEVVACPEEHKREPASGAKLL